MTVFDHPLWPSLKPYARLSEGRDNLDLLQLPDDLRAKAMMVEIPCVACGELCSVFRARMKSDRSRVAGRVEEHRLFYAATCPSAVNVGCARSKAAKEHKRRVRERLGGQREAAATLSIQVCDGSGAVLYAVKTDGREPLRFDLPRGARSIALVLA